MFEDFSSTLPPILYFIDKEYQSSHPDTLKKIENKKIDPDEMLQMAIKNKVLYYFCTKILEEKQDIGIGSQKIRAILDKGKKRLVRVAETLELISSLFTSEELDFLIIKTFKGLPYKTLDVDVHIRDKDYGQAIHALKSRGASIVGGRFLNIVLKLPVNLTLTYRLKGSINIDMYKDIPWRGFPSLDEEFLWKSPRLVDVYGVRCPIPNPEADLLSLLASALFTDRSFTLLDFLYINSLLKGSLNFSELLRQTRKYGWNSQFLKLISIMRNMQRIIYQNQHIPGYVKFPYTAPIHLSFGALQGPLRYKTAKKPKSFPSTLATLGFHVFTGRIYRDIPKIKHSLMHALKRMVR